MWSVFLKELRQFRHSKTCFIAPGIVLFFGIMAMLNCVLPDAESKNNIHPLCAFLYFSSWVAGLFIFSQGAMQWRQERGDAALDMLLTTPLNLYQVCAGKFLSAWLLALVPAMVLMPELIYIKAVNLTEYLLLTPGISGALGSIILSVGGLKMRRKLPASPVLFLIFLSTIPLLGLATLLTTDYGVQFSNWVVLSLFIASILILGGTLMLAQAAAVNANRLLPLKLFLVAHALIFPYCLFQSGKFSYDLSNIYSGELLGMAVIFGIMAAGERFHQSRRVRLSRQNHPILLLPLTIFSTGAVNSLLWSVSFVVVAALIMPYHHVAFQRPDLLSKMVLCYIYLGLTWRIRQYWLGNPERKPLNGMLILLVLLAMSCAIPTFALIFFDNPPDFINYLSPCFLPPKFAHQTTYIGVTGIIALILLGPEILQSCREFHKKD